MTGAVGACFSPPGFDNPWGPNDDLTLLSKLASKINRFSFNAGVAIAEHKETLDLITDRSKRLAAAADYVANSSTRRAAAALRCRYPRRNIKKRDFASMWLEWRYGWQPLVQDIYGAAEALSDHFYKGDVTQYDFRAVISRKTNRLVSDNGISFPLSERRITKRITCRFQESGLTEADRLGLLNPEYVLWERVPYSFLADWAVPIGTFLEVAGVLDYLRAPTYVRSTKDETIYRGATTGSLYIVTDADSYLLHTVNYTRTLGYTANVPFPRRRPLNEIASWGHCANALALLIQKFTKVR
jgi:hypothetical protein